MKAVIKFNLADEGDQYKYKIMMRAENTECFLDEWESRLRNIVKHREMTEEQAAIVHELNRLYHTLKTEHLTEEI